ncbi:tRNA1(Val) (adenine(37)-N6)-methyltransferase [Pedobacter sandarakinus]|uniref:tRNA1(Val) (adenine(37)-N6)-methyltransferase n=1 Tax=Pedobacter sandarakinus TaxID=353156 RepID=UPI0022485D25|nr:methyltransferase [Pedobacter sandarakinus]
MSVFKFKQFEIDQAGCAMKINTDGVLLGAMAAFQSPRRILDIGTGTGVIAMMLAQRFEGAQVEAIEIDKEAALAAGNNFKRSTFGNRLSVYHISIEDFISDRKYDLVVSNPPFFVNDLKSSELRKGIARHADETFFESLIKKANSLLTEKGSIWIILPNKQAGQVIDFAKAYSLNLIIKVNIHSDCTRPTIRQIICLSKEAQELYETDFYIYDSPKLHTEAYQVLLKDFFLAY